MIGFSGDKDYTGIVLRINQGITGVNRRSNGSLIKFVFASIYTHNIYVYIYIFMCIYIYIFVYLFSERESARACMCVYIYIYVL